MNQPLKGVRVLEYGTGAGAGYAAALLADLGAQVTKVAGPQQSLPTDAARLRREAEELFLDSDKTVVQAQIGDDQFLQWVREADVIVRGVDPSSGDAATLREEYEQWRALNAGVVFLAQTPFGVSGPGAVWRGGDLNAQAISGWTSIVGNLGEAPLSMNYGIAALQQGLNGAGAALAALVERGGAEGEFVDVSEADVIAACIRMYSLTYRFLDIKVVRNGHRAPGSSGRYPHTILPCKDGYISTIGRSETDWNRFVDMMGNPAWAAEPRYRNFFAMGTEYPEEVDALIIPWLMQHTKDELADLAIQYKVPLAPVRTVDEVLRNPQFEYRKFLRTRLSQDGKEVKVPGMVAQWTTVGEEASA